MIQAYKISNGNFEPAIVSEHSKSIFIDRELYLRLSRAKPEELNKIDADLKNSLADYQFVCITKAEDGTYFVEKIEEADMSLAVPISRRYKLGGD